MSKDMDIETGGLQAFAGDTQLKMDYAKVSPNITTTACTCANLPGGAAFRAADEKSKGDIQKVLTRADQLFNGVRAGATKMAETYHRTEEGVVQTLDKVAPREQKLTEIDNELKLADRLGRPQ